MACCSGTATWKTPLPAVVGEVTEFAIPEQVSPWPCPLDGAAQVAHQPSSITARGSSNPHGPRSDVDAPGQGEEGVLEQLEAETSWRGANPGCPG